MQQLIIFSRRASRAFSKHQLRDGAKARCPFNAIKKSFNEDRKQRLLTGPG